MLGVAIGATTVDPGPTGDSPSPKALGIGAGIWWLVSGILAIFAGAWVAARLAGVRRQLEGPLHGIVTWALVAVLATVLMMSVVGSLISGAFRVVGATASIAGSGVKAVAGQVASSAPNDPDVAWNQVWQEAQTMLQQTETKQLQPENLREDLGAAAQDLRRADIEAALSRLSRSARNTVSAADKDSAVNVLTARTGMSETEARQAVDRWSSTLQSAWASTGQAAGQAIDQVQHTAAVAADKTVDAVSAAAWWTFFYLLLTAIAAGVGGFLGTPRNGRDKRGHHNTPDRQDRDTQTTTVIRPEPGV